MDYLFILFFAALFYLLLCKIISWIKDTFPQYAIKQQKQTFSEKEIKNTQITSIFNILLGTFILSFIWPLVRISSHTNNNIFIELFKLLCMFFISDTMFYWSHRLLHIPWIFKLAHKQHHMHNAPFSWTSLYVHPIEFIVALFSIFIFPLFLFSLHPITLLLFLCGILFSLVFSHSGLKFSSWLDSSHHDIHHQKRKGNYGSDIGIWDLICHTSL